MSTSKQYIKNAVEKNSSAQISDKKSTSSDTYRSKIGRLSWKLALMWWTEAVSSKGAFDMELPKHKTKLATRRGHHDGAAA